MTRVDLRQRRDLSLLLFYLSSVLFGVGPKQRWVSLTPRTSGSEPVPTRWTDRAILG